MSEASVLMTRILEKTILSFQSLEHEGRLCAAAMLAAPRVSECHMRTPPYAI